LPELPDPSLVWDDPSAVDRCALTEIVVDKIVIAPHPHKIDEATPNQPRTPMLQ
jgi:hypothetical protein